MKNSVLFGALIAFSAPFLASAQCPAGTTADTLLLGKTYAFRLAGRQTSAIGTFTGYPGGYLAITESVADISGGNSNIITRGAPTSGRWMVNPDCSGMLMFNLNREAFQLTFTAVVGGQLNLTGNNTSNPNALAGVQRVGAPPDPSLMSGIARVNPPSSCGLSSPLGVLANTTWKYALAGGGVAETGTFQALLPNPNAYSGLLSILARTDVTTPPPPTPSVTLYDTFGASGRYTVYGDCSGGEFMFMAANGFSIQVEYVFSRADFSEVFMLRDDTGGSLPNILVGTGTRQ